MPLRSQPEQSDEPWHLPLEEEFGWAQALGSSDEALTAICARIRERDGVRDQWRSEEDPTRPARRAWSYITPLFLDRGNFPTRAAALAAWERETQRRRVEERAEEREKAETLRSVQYWGTNRDAADPDEPYFTCVWGDNTQTVQPLTGCFDSNFLDMVQAKTHKARPTPVVGARRPRTVRDASAASGAPTKRQKTGQTGQRGQTTELGHAAAMVGGEAEGIRVHSCWPAVGRSHCIDGNISSPSLPDPPVVQFRKSDGHCVPYALFNVEYFSKKHRQNIVRRLGSHLSSLGRLSDAISRLYGVSLQPLHPRLTAETMTATIGRWRSDATTAVLIADDSHCVSVRAGWVFDAAEQHALPLKPETLTRCGFALAEVGRWEVRVVRRANVALAT